MDVEGLIILTVLWLHFDAYADGCTAEEAFTAEYQWQQVRDALLGG